MLQPGVYKYTILLQLSARRQCNLMNAFLFASFSACPLWWHVLYKIKFSSIPKSFVYHHDKHCKTINIFLANIIFALAVTINQIYNV